MTTQDQVGRVIAGKYRLTGVLGRGGMGVVWRAEQLDENGRALREVAVKTVLPDVAERFGDVMVRRFQREVRAAIRLSSPHVVRVYDAGRELDGEFYLVMELVEGPTLKQVPLHELTPEVAVTIASQICEALAEAHGLPEPVIHRDLKPANLFLRNWPQQVRVQVGDFGIAKVVGEETTDLTTTGSSLGTPLYMSPEQWKSKAVDGRADLYALGVLLHQMLAGRTPFSGDHVQLLYQHLHDSPPPLPESLPLKLRQLVDALLAKDPRDRPGSAIEVGRILGEIATGRPGGISTQSHREELDSAITKTRLPVPGPSPSTDLRREGGHRLRLSRASRSAAIVIATAIGASAAWRYVGSLEKESATGSAASAENRAVAASDSGKAAASTNEASALRMKDHWAIPGGTVLELRVTSDQDDWTMTVASLGETTVENQAVSASRVSNKDRELYTAFNAIDDSGIYEFAVRFPEEGRPEVSPSRDYWLKSPLRVGTLWTRKLKTHQWKEGDVEFLLTCSIESMEPSITVAARTYRSPVEVHCRSDVATAPSGKLEGAVLDYRVWLVAGVGIVRMRREFLFKDERYASRSVTLRAELSSYSRVGTGG